MRRAILRRRPGQEQKSWTQNTLVLRRAETKIQAQMHSLGNVRQAFCALALCTLFGYIFVFIHYHGWQEIVASHDTLVENPTTKG